MRLEVNIACRARGARALGVCPWKSFMADGDCSLSWRALAIGPEEVAPNSTYSQPQYTRSPPTTARTFFSSILASDVRCGLLGTTSQHRSTRRRPIWQLDLRSCEFSQWLMLLPANCQKWYALRLLEALLSASQYFAWPCLGSLLSIHLGGSAVACLVRTFHVG